MNEEKELVDMIYYIGIRPNKDHYTFNDIMTLFYLMDITGTLRVEYYYDFLEKFYDYISNVKDNKEKMNA